MGHMLALAFANRNSFRVLLWIVNERAVCPGRGVRLVVATAECHSVKIPLYLSYSMGGDNLIRCESLEDCEYAVRYYFASLASSQCLDRLPCRVLLRARRRTDGGLWRTRVLAGCAAVPVIWWPWRSLENGSSAEGNALTCFLQ